MRKAGAAWRRYKSTLRLRLRGDDIQRLIEAMPLKGVKPEDWMIFSQNENSPEQRAIRQRNLIMKRNCVRKSTHNTGRHGYAQAEQNFKDENQGRNPLRVELWLYTHKKKGDGYSPHNIQFATKLEGLLAIMRENGTVETLDSGPLFDTFGVEKGGSTRCVGSTISRTALMASSFAQQMLAEVDLERVEWREEMKSLRADNQQVISQMKELTEGLKNGRYSNCGPTQIIPSNIPASDPSFNPGSSQLFQWIPCRILSHRGVIVAHGSKAPLGSTHSVNGHVMLPREAKVLIVEVTDFTYPVFRGLQDGAKTLGEVSSGTILYWHDDYLPLED